MTFFPDMTCFHSAAGSGDRAGSCDSRCKPGRKSGRKPFWLRSASLAVAGFAAVMSLTNPASARSAHADPAAAIFVDRTEGAPIMAIVSLQSQMVTIYDADGWIMRAPVSSGQRGRETPAGVFAVIEKDPDHHSNLYDDAWMPNMHRITWSGIALHGGPLPGYAASHGCVRLPYSFAEHLFSTTQLGMRVIIAPTDVAPAEITHPALFRSNPASRDAAAARAAEAAEAAGKADQAKRAAAAAARDAARAAMPLHAAERVKSRADARLADAERAVASARSDESRERAETARAKAAADVAAADAQLAAAKADQQAKLDAAEQARQAGVEAEARRKETADAARKAARELEPASVFISRKTQRLYVRQAFQPVLDIPITIQDPDRPIGTHVFTALSRIDGTADLRWSVVSLESGGQHDGAQGGNWRDVEPAPTDPAGAKAALDRIVIPQDVRDRLTGIMSPRSSVIISDEALSPETGKGTEFIVVMSDEPQGGIKFRRHFSPLTVARRDRPDDPPSRAPFFFFPFAR